MIENTQSRSSRELTGLLALATGDAGAVIEAQERAGQAQLVHSDRLPTRIQGDRAEFEALGFTFGEPDVSDPLFTPATLPDGWKRERSDHAMWSYITDPQGRRRVSIFYKAAFYDRDAFMSLTAVSGYVSACTYEGGEVVTDAEWATPAAVAEAARQRAAQAAEQVAFWTEHENAEYVAKYAQERDAYNALAALHETDSD
ncbi:hypothetical protein [Streptomyces sp. NBC_00687]|uniref:hypothetical protein n=1 Tax=Streptomyces sp. NBC_00687 TaxID=2975807 RepID=UPI00225415EE|nr:hypothetical protein [Streptomyces sp. NBC_00687]MCX4912837.1 hypothetical protein [Streptomyces sp. NBC_00687]